MTGFFQALLWPGTYLIAHMPVVFASGRNAFHFSACLFWLTLIVMTFALFRRWRRINPNAQMKD